jgi:hypothetical protein
VASFDHKVERGDQHEAMEEMTEVFTMESGL